MDKELLDKVKRGIDAGRPSEDIKADLTSQGFMEDEVMEALHDLRGFERSSEEKRDIRLFTFKEVFDRVGYGFSSVQFVNILFYSIGANYFLIGIINGLKAILSILFSSFLQEYANLRQVSTKFLSKAGVLFGFSFIFIAMAITMRSIPLFSAAILIGAIGVVSYGDLYEQLTERHLKKEKLGKFLLNISHFGVIITGLAMILSGILFDRFPIVGAERIVLFGKSMPVFGYLICFEITAIAFILSGYVLHFVKENIPSQEKLKGFISGHLKKIKEQNKVFFKNKSLVFLLIASSITGLVQILGNSFYGVYIYRKFQEGLFEGIFSGIFLNLAFIFLFAIVVSFIGPAFSRYLNKRVGLAPSLVFGSLLTAIMPLVAVYNPKFMPLLIANALAVLGAGILGMGQGLLVRKLLRDDERSLYYAVLSIGVLVPFLILIPLGSWLAQISLMLLFQVLGGVILFLAAPIYFVLVVLANKQRL